MSRPRAIEQYRHALRALDDWRPFLLAESGLPGARANLELVRAAAEEADEPRLMRLADSEEEFLVMCGAVGLGRLAAEGKRGHLARLRELACDPRWRVREAVALALQRWGEGDFEAMAAEAAAGRSALLSSSAQQSPLSANRVSFGRLKRRGLRSRSSTT